ncbi:carbohydrate-binding module family 1 protein [Trichoderma cornu-damae]|uniref:Carbohydrate-binding module family 1 protein n=1 Tax=Trichoderma cornu-damae TaxID=654480 RepID=A0A9P8QP37_9HYPO|nr:carbohydrate-binding module family 1 protein [Trichoderma cornu-damae]
MVRHTSLLALAAALSSLSIAQISDDFEQGWNQTIWPTYAPSCNQGGSVSLDTTVAHSGSNSIKVVGGPNGFCGHIFFGTTKVPTGDVYVGVWLRLETALNNDHVTFIIMPDNAQGGDDLRIGGQSQVLDYNRESDDATLPDLSPQGIASSVNLPTGSFQCFEYYLGIDGTIQTWLNGNLISGMTAGPNADNPNNAGWTRQPYVPDITGVYFGWEAYSGGINTVWFDDVAIETSRVGCGGPAVSSTVSGPTTTKPSTTIPPTTSKTISSAGATQT